MAGRPPIQTAPQDTWTTQVTSNAPTICPSAAGGNATFLVGVINNSLSAQTVTLYVYDNASAASGVVAMSIGPMGISQVITFPGFGIRLANGCVVLASGNPTANGFSVTTR